MAFRIIGCPVWGARRPTQPPVLVPRARRIIFHHTAGHGIDLPSPKDREEGMRYARAIQNMHMNQGWNDSGHNFLVMRSGVVLQGRWLTISAIQAGKMVSSAHCPGQNDQIGIEHEHVGDEEMTRKQFEAAAQLQAWIATEYGLKRVLPVDPHSKYYATACPANLKGDIRGIRERAQEILTSDV